MRASEESSTGGVGVTETAGLFERIGWAPLENRDRHDLGTDLLVAARDPRRFDRGVLIGVQAKGGPSWFSEPVLAHGGETVGWWHRNDSEHFDYWIKHHLPHLVVLYDIEARTGYWVHVTVDRCESTGKGCKVFVPKQNTISESDAPRLLEVALAQRASISLEGTSFDAASTQVPPCDRLRYALLIPRLVAPHPNRGTNFALEPEEAIALLVLMQVTRLMGHLEKHGDWPKLDEEPQSSDWRWHFAFALWRFIAHHDLSGLRAVRSSASREDWRAAATAALAAAELSVGNRSEGTKIIAIELARDKAAPVDHAWLHLHACRSAMDAGLEETARSHASQAASALATVGDDPTASLLAGNAFRTLFNLTSWDRQSETISQALRAGDNAGSWWRDQQLRWALDSAAQSQFREWAQDDSSRWDAEPPMQQLLPSVLMALFSADKTGWAAAEARLGRYGVQRATTDDEFRSAFARLLNSGDKESVVLAGRRAWRFGPASALAELSKACVPCNFTPGRFDACLAFWQAFGDVSDPASAEEVVEWCLAKVTVPGAESRAKVSEPRASALFSAIGGSLSACSDASRERVAAGLSSVILHWTDLSELSSVAEELERLGASNLDAQLFLSLAEDNHGRTERMRLLGLSARLGSSPALAKLLEAAVAGDLLAAAIAFQANTLTDETSKHVVQALEAQLEHERRDAASGNVGLGYSVDRCLLLMDMSLRFPSLARWDTVLSYLGDSAIVADHKVRTVDRIVRNVAQVPSDVVDGLRAQIAGIEASRYLPSNLLEPGAKQRPASRLAALLKFGLGSQSDLDLEDFVSTTLASKDDSDVAWTVLWAMRPPGYDLLALQSVDDSKPTNRDRAARFAARRISAGAESHTLRRATERIVADGSVLLPRAFLSDLCEPLPDWVRLLIGRLLVHPSASVRAAARRFSDPPP